MGTSTTLNQWLPKKEQIIIYQGDSFKLTVPIKKADGTPLDLTGATGLAAIKKESDNTLVDNFTVTTDGTGGNAICKLTSTQTQILPLETLKSDVQITIGDDVTTYLRLRCSVEADVTN